MYRKLYFIALLLLPLFSMAQSNYKSGYVINIKGDTLRGYIDYKEWGRNPQNINFKAALDDKTQRLGLNDITYFEISNAVSYKEYNVNISLTSVDISSAPSLRDTSSRTDNVFLKILQKGRYVTLYSYNDVVKNRFYIKENNAEMPTELVYGVYERPGNSNGIIEINSYRDQFNQLAIKYGAGSDKLSAQIAEAKYDEDNLVPISARINGGEALKVPSSLSSSGSGPKLRLFVGAAYNISTLSYTPIGGFYPGSVPSTSGSPKLTLGIDAFVNPDIGHLIFRLELSYKQQSSYHFQETNTPLNFADGEIKSQTLKQNNISVTPQVIYNIYNANSVKIFIDLGPSINISSYSSQVTTKTISGVSTNNGSTADYRNIWLNIQLKAGVVVSKRLEIYGAYYPTAAIAKGDVHLGTDSSGYSGDLSAYQVGINYLFR